MKRLFSGMKYFSKMFKTFLILLTGILTNYAETSIAITEVLKDPEGLESAIPGGASHEFIEFLNLGGETVFNLEGMEIVGDTITLSISYAGGCEEHSFSLYMSPATFLESYPVQANLYLRHDSNGDACEALISEDISFNLHPVALLYKKIYGQFDEIVINVFEYKSNDKLNDSYCLLSGIG